MCSAVVAWCAAAVWYAGAAAESIGGAECAEVRRVFAARGIGSPHLVPDTGTTGRDLTLCPSVQTCCTKTMEDHYEEAGKKDFKNMLKGAGSYLKTFLSTSATKFRDTFLEMVQVAANSTNALFLDVYQPFEAQAQVLLGQLYADLLAYMSGKDVDLEERVSSFFDSMFPVAYHHSVNTNEKAFSEAFQECLRDAQLEVRPFGDLSASIASQVSRSFEVARMFLGALQLGVEVINTTEHMDFGAECSEAFVRMGYCPHCLGFFQAKPCSGMCLNVARGCLSSVSELDDLWSEYVSALERLTSGMVGIHNIEHVLSTLDTRISETVSYLMANSVEVTKRVKEKCGLPRRVSRQASPVMRRFPARLPSDPSLYLLLQNVVHKMADSKEFYANLADSLCTNGSRVGKGEPDCWNGQSFSQYTKTVAGIGVQAQKYNPEMKPPQVRDITVNTLADKLKHVKQVLSHRVMSVLQSDSSVVVAEGSGGGSGGSWWRTSDDEDDAGASGSGDFHKESKEDFDFEPTELSASASLNSQVCVVVLTMFGSFLLARRK